MKLFYRIAEGAHTGKNEPLGGEDPVFGSGEFDVSASVFEGAPNAE